MALVVLKKSFFCDGHLVMNSLFTLYKNIEHENHNKYGNGAICIEI